MDDGYCSDGGHKRAYPLLTDPGIWHTRLTMWQLSNETPFAAKSSWTRDERGAEFWLIAVRACFDIDLDGRQSLAKEQTAVQPAPVFFGDPMTTGLRTDTDFVLQKNGTDVLVDGRAYAPKGRPTTHCSVHLNVESINKTLNVWGERRIIKRSLGLTITEPLPFLDAPLSWETTYGGWDQKGESEDWEPSNPVGRGFATDLSHLDETLAPNVEYPGAPYRGPGSGRPAAFTPVAHHWQPRVGYAGTYDKRWQETRDPLVPADFDRRYFQSAPADQQTQKPLVGYEEVAVGGFGPEEPFRFILPRIKFDIITTMKSYGDILQEPTIHTLWLAPDQRHFEIVYLSALEVPPGREEKLVGTRVRTRQVGASAAISRTGVWSAG